MTAALAHTVALELRLVTRRVRRRVSLARRSVASLRLPPTSLLDRFESLGDVCELAGLQRANGIERAALFNWRATTIPMLVKALDSNLEGVDRIDNLRLKLAATPGAPRRREYMLFNEALGAYSHTFVREGQIEPEDLIKREHRELTMLKRKFLSDVAAARRIYVFRSRNPVTITEATSLAVALRRKSPDNILLWVSEARDVASSGAVTPISAGLMHGEIDALATYEEGMTCRTSHWPLLLSNALACVQVPATQLEAALA
jgi:hypothetical protein